MCYVMKKIFIQFLTTIFVAFCYLFSHAWPLFQICFTFCIHSVLAMHVHVRDFLSNLVSSSLYFCHSFYLVGTDLRPFCYSTVLLFYILIGGGVGGIEPEKPTVSPNQGTIHFTSQSSFIWIILVYSITDFQ